MVHVDSYDTPRLDYTIAGHEHSCSTFQTSGDYREEHND